jgi:hypothetical protein
MKRVVIEMTNEELSDGSNAEIGLKLTDIITQSLRWWHGQFGENDRLRLNSWRVNSIEVTESSQKKR